MADQITDATACAPPTPFVDLASASDPSLLALLRAHPRVREVQEDHEPGLRFRCGEWHRQIHVGAAVEELKGLVELMDNNPLVCADSISVPSPAATLALVALGPLAAASLIVESPTLITNVEVDEEEIASFLATAGWEEGVMVHAAPQDLRGAVAVTAMAAIHTPDDLDELDDLYLERYGRSFYVHRDETSEWDVGLVLGKPHALYRLRISPDVPISLLTVQAIADRHGKCGSAQVVHAMNVMCGFEESLGIGP